MSARLAMAVVLVGAVACGEPDDVRQPLEFNHQIHVGKHAIPCTDCHVGAEREVHAGLPALSRCLMCHMKPQAPEPNPREQRVRELAAQRAPLRWVQVTRNPGHVYFSHRAHVGIGKLPCADCHGDVASWTGPPRSATRELVSMGACLSCHRASGASTSCTACHQ